MSATVVIPSQGKSTALIGLLGALAAQNYTEGLDVTVVTETSTHGDVERLISQSPAPGLRLLVANTKGAAAARNLGVSSAAGRTIIFVDDDMAVGRSFVSAHITAVAQASKAVSLGRIFTPERGAMMARAKARWLNEHYERLEWREVAPRDLYSGNFALSATLFEECGGFDPTWPSMHDTELGMRLSRSGACFVYTRDALAQQDIHKSNQEVLADYESLARFRALLVAEYDNHHLPELSRVAPTTYQLFVSALARLPVPLWRASIAALGRRRLLSTPVPSLLRAAAVSRGKETVSDVPDAY